MKKILITNDYFAPDLYGGAESVVLELARGLRLREIDVTVLTTGNPKVKEFDGIPSIRLPVHRYFMNLAVPWIYKHAKGVDLIQANNYNTCFPALIAGKMLGIPVICIVHALWGDKWTEIRGFVRGNISRFIEKFQLLHGYNKFIFLSDFSRNEGLKLGIPERLTQVIPPGIKHGEYRTATKENFVLFVGRLSKQKGIDYLMQAAGQLPNIEFKVVGTGKGEGKIQSLIPKNVEFLGYVSHERLLDLYARAPIFCLPSIAETFGLVIIEAMASGCAIVSTVPLDYEGRKIDIRNVDQLREAIRYLFDNRNVCLKMGEINRNKIKVYNWDNFVDSLIKVYEEALREGIK